MPSNKVKWMGRLIARRDEDAAKYFLECANSNAKLISQAFIWSDTPQGYDFWHELHEQIHEKKDVE